MSALETQKNNFKESAVLTDSLLSAHDYFNNVGAVLKKYFPDDQDDEIAVLTNIAQKKIPPDEVSVQLQKFVYRYSSAAEALKNIKAPSNSTALHAGFTNSLGNIALSLKEISNFSSDPILGSIGIQSYRIEAARSRVLFAHAKDFAKKHDISFTKNDPGYELQRYYERIKI